MDVLSFGVNTLCRACMASIEGAEFKFFERANLAEIFTTCTSLEVSSVDTKPQALCQNCFSRLDGFHQFYTMCIESDKKWSKMYNSLNDNGIEPNCTPLVQCKFEAEDFKLTENEKGNEARDTFSNDSYGKIETPESTLNNREDDNIDEVEVDDGHVKYKEVNADSDGEKSENNSTKGMFSCTKCDKKFYRKRRFEGHLRQHEGLKPCVCEKCGKEFCKWSGLDDHMKIVHENRKLPVYMCSVQGCGKSYQSRQALRAHENKVHDPKESLKVASKFICEVCGRALTTSGALKKHNFIHTGVRPFACDRCPKKYSTRHKLKEHILRHTGVKNFVCPHCGLKKISRHELNVHINFHTKEKTKKCQYCDMSFCNNGNLSRHIRIVHKGIKTFPCTYCDRMFGKAETLKHHVMTHTGEKPHECSICNKRFIQAVALQTHMKRHNKNRNKKNKECDSMINSGELVENDQF